MKIINELRRFFDLDTKKLSAKHFSAAIAALIALVPVAYTAISWQGGLFILYLFGYILLPGHFLYRLIFKENGGTAVKLLSSFYLGLALLFAQYYIVSLAGTLLPLRFLSPVLAIYEAVVAIRTMLKNKTLQKKRGRLFAFIADHHLFMWLLCAAVCYSFYILNFRYSTPDTVYSSDMQWHMGNIYTLSRTGFGDIRVEGMIFKYHYFSDLFFAIGRVAVGLVPYNCVLRLPVIITPVLMTVSVYEFFRVAAPGRIQRAFFSFCLLFIVPLFGEYNDVTYQWLTNLNAVGLALPCGLLLLIFVRDNLLNSSGNKASWRNAVFAAILTAMLAGLKGPFAVSVLGAFAAFTVYSLMKRLKPGVGWYITVACVSAGFLAVWFTLLNGGLNDSYILSGRIAASVKHSSILVPVIDALGDNLFARLVMLPVQFILVTGIFALPFAVTLIRAVISVFRKKDDAPGAFAVFCAFGAFISLGAYYYFDMLGRSQNYFLYFAVPMIVYSGVIEITRWFKKFTQYRSGPGKAVKTVLVLTAVIAVVFAGFNPMLEDRISLYTPGELGAIEWINKNVPDDSLLAVNRHETFYLITGFTGKQVYVEGVYYAKNSGVTMEMLENRVALNDELFHYDTTMERRIEIAQQIGAHYLVQWRNSYADSALTGRFEEGFNAVYVSDDVVIWQLS